TGASSSAVDEGRRVVVALRGRTDAYRDHIKAAFVGAGLSLVPDECGEYSTTGNECRTMVRRSDRLASGEISPTGRAWMRRLPWAVASRGPAMTVRPVRWAVSRHRSAFWEPPPTMWMVSTLTPVSASAASMVCR